MSVTIRDTRRAISEHSALTGDAFPVSAEVAAAALNAAGLPLGALIHLPMGYLGEHDDFPSAMAAVAKVVHTNVDFTDWPFTDIDWVAAASHIDLAKSQLVLVHERHWFDMAGAAQP